MIRTLLSSVLALGFAGTAFAGTVFTATLETPIEQSEKVVAVKVLWNCANTTCVAELPRKTVNVGTCRKVVKKIGKVSAFSNTKGALSDEQLETCNKAAK